MKVQLSEWLENGGVDVIMKGNSTRSILLKFMNDTGRTSADQTKIFGIMSENVAHGVSIASKSLYNLLDTACTIDRVVSQLDKPINMNTGQQLPIIPFGDWVGATGVSQDETKITMNGSQIIVHNITGDCLVDVTIPAQLLNGIQYNEQQVVLKFTIGSD